MAMLWSHLVGGCRQKIGGFSFCDTMIAYLLVAQGTAKLQLGSIVTVFGAWA